MGHLELQTGAWIGMTTSKTRWAESPKTTGGPGLGNATPEHA